MLITNNFHNAGGAVWDISTNEDGRVPKVIFTESSLLLSVTLGGPQLRYRDVCKRDMKELNIYLKNWEELAMNHSRWRSNLQTALKLKKEYIITTSDNTTQAPKSKKLKLPASTCLKITKNTLKTARVLCQKVQPSRIFTKDNRLIVFCNQPPLQLVLKILRLLITETHVKCDKTKNLL